MGAFMKSLQKWLWVLIWSTAIFYFSSIPGLKSSLSCDFILRKLAHVTEYFFLTFLLYRAIRGSVRIQSRHLSILLMTVVLLYAASDEIHQLFVSGRHGHPIDILIDGVGALLFLMIAQVLTRVMSQVWLDRREPSID